MSDDNNILVTGNFDNNVYIYYRENGTFSLSQPIPESGDVFVTDITSDGQMLLIVEGALRIY